VIPDACSLPVKRKTAAQDFLVLKKHLAVVFFFSVTFLLDAVILDQNKCTPSAGVSVC